MAEERDREHSRRVVQIVCIALLLSLLSAMVATEAVRSSAAVGKETARVQTVTETRTVTGYLLRDETILQSTNYGPCEYLVPEGAAVAAGAEIARVYQDDTGKDKRERAAVYYDEIETLARNVTPDTEPWQAAYLSAYAAYAAALDAGNAYGAAEAAAALSAAVGRREVSLPDGRGEATASAEEARIRELRDAAEELVRYVGEPQTVVSETAGRFYREADGCEAVLGTDLAATVTPTEFFALLNTAESRADTAIGKLVSGTAWYLIVPATAAEAAAFSEGATYPVSFPNGANAALTLARVARDANAESGQTLLCFRADTMPENLPAARCQRAVITVGSVSGISVPASALREENGVRGVFVAAEGTARFREVRPVYERNGCVLATTESGVGLLAEGEEIVITPRRIYEGKALR